MPPSRSRIIGAAMDLIERDGLHAVTMQRLATALGCGVVALYSHVPSIQALLDGVADAVMSGTGVAPASAASWEDQLVAQARALREAARAHPRCAALAASRPPSSAVRLHPLEHALAALRSAGLGKQDSVRVVRAFAAYAVGSLLREADAMAGLAGPESAVISRRLRKTEFPQVTDLAAELTRQDPDADFEFGLRLLVHATTALLPAARQTAPCSG